ncbi:hypothetical protein CONPUDRAFT_68212, partial [Coniophora puteana RWD-64-598 SS2]
PFREENGWQESSVKIPLPFEGKATRGGEANVPTLEVNGIYHRKIASVIQAALEDPTVSTTYNTTPFEQRWKTSDGRDIRVYSEAYSSDACLDAFHEVQHDSRIPNDGLERMVVSIMLWSDSTRLANFGEASLWPIYMQLGNQSKYTRGKPSAKACHHLAYIPKLPSGWQHEYEKIYGKPPTTDVHTHLKRELVQAIWRILLQDKDFRRAYTEGLVAQCGDGIIRRALIRFFTYTGDYPEKMILCTLKFLGQMPCPRCLTPKRYLGEMGTKLDMQRRIRHRIDSTQRQDLIQRARTRIFKKGYSIKSSRISSLLTSHSYVPTLNAFSEFLLEQGVNFFSLFVVDLLHEFELGVWKAIFIHLVRILLAVGGSAAVKVNSR